ncbi:MULTISPECIES: AfsR/SARP family transcriptional regulator [Actinosynnema]|uniref:AfsR/SARP family transcriptional regulator n=1 Tax=Actinosynnema TaxID=40566 RepID=UPI0020A32DE0|nr:AfsR/SARP family transcriptional regulator [Actinosynnema pretiosum]MCP2098740.1 DNA-binding transcriptional activator of the SARP family [Actinosynnema pretiosum]
MEFRLLGPLEVWAGARRVPLGGARSECVLAVLLLEAGRVVSLPTLLQAAWGAQPPPTAVNQVRKIVAELRRRVPGGARVITTDGSGYRADVTEERTDLGVFDRCLRQAREAAAGGDARAETAHLHEALALWRGPVLAGLDSPVIGPAATILQERRLAAADRLAELRLAGGEGRELVPELHARLVEDPLRESTRGQLMLALYRAGRQAEALRLYREGRRLLGDELGVDPGRELASLHERMLRSDPALAGVERAPAAPVFAAPPQALPYAMADFVGRAAEQERIRERVREGRGGLTIIGLDGMPGVGKTSLAVHVAHGLAEEFPHGRFYVDLHGHSPVRPPVGPEEALEVLLRQAGVPSDRLPPGTVGRAALWRMRTAGRRLVVLLDNAVDTAQVRPLLPGAADSVVVVTSRSRIAGLDGALTLSLEPPPPDEVLRVVEGVLGADRVAAEPEAARELVTACGGLPLAVRIACTRLHNRPAWSIAHMVERLRDRRGGLGELAVEDRSVAAAVGLSFEELEPAHRRVLRLVGALPSADFDAHRVAELAGLAVDRAEAVLERLLDVRLLAQRSPGRYAVHEVVRAYTRGLPGPPAEAADADVDRDGNDAGSARSAGGSGWAVGASGSGGAVGAGGGPAGGSGADELPGGGGPGGGACGGESPHGAGGEPPHGVNGEPPDGTGGEPSRSANGGPPHGVGADKPPDSPATAANPRGDRTPKPDRTPDPDRDAGLGSPPDARDRGTTAANPRGDRTPKPDRTPDPDSDPDAGLGSPPDARDRGTTPATAANPDPCAPVSASPAPSPPPLSPR